MIHFKIYTAIRKPQGSLLLLQEPTSGPCDKPEKFYSSL